MLKVVPPATVCTGKRRLGGDAAPVLPTERLPIRTPLYRCVARPVPAASVLDAAGRSELDATQPGSEALLPAGGAISVSLDIPVAAAGYRICEYVSLRPALLLHSDAPLSDDVVVAHGADGWVDVRTRQVWLVAAASLLQLIDDDRQSGRVQAFLPDLFLRRTMAQQR
jgi:hypothetical protein